MFAICILVFLKLVSTIDGSLGPQLNTFKVPTSASNSEDFSPCGGTNVTFSIGCGISPRVNSHNMPPNVAAFGEFPWQVAIIDAYEQSFLCSGVLLSHKTVLTAAQCVDGIPTSDLRVRLGEWDILSDKDPRETYRSFEVPVSKKYFHPDMSSERLSELQSVSLLKLRKYVNFGQYPHVAPACLPTSVNTILSQEIPSLRCYVAGWSESALRPLNSWSTADRSNQFGKRGNDANERMTHDFEVTPTPKPCLTTASYDENDSCYATNAPPMHQNDRNQRNGQRVPRKFDAADASQDESTAEWSRVLGKAQVRVLLHEECMQQTNHAAHLETSSMCIVPAEEETHPCQADIGAAVVCEMPFWKQQQSTAGKREKSRQKQQAGEEQSPQFVVLGVVTQSYSCYPTGTASTEGKQSSPVIATSILRILNHVCTVAGATKN